MSKIELHTEQLRVLIGQQITIDGTAYQVIEILEDGPALILQNCSSQTTIQADQHGEAHRRVPSTITLPVLERDSGEFHPSFTALKLDQRLKSTSNNS